MKKIYLFLFGLMSVSGLNAQIVEIPMVDFEPEGASLITVQQNPNPNTRLEQLGVVPNDQTGTNSSANVYNISVTSATGGNWDDGIYLLFSANNNITTDNTNRYLHIAMYSNMAKLEFDGNQVDELTVTISGRQSKTKLQNFTTNQWFDCVLHLKAGQSLNNYNFKICIDGRGVDGNNNGKFLYIDEIVLSNSSNPRTTIPTPPPSRLTTYTPQLPSLANWETPNAADCSIGTSMQNNAVVANTATDAINGNATTQSYYAQSTTNSSQTDNLKITFLTPVTTSATNKYLHIFMKTNTARFEIRPNGNGTIGHMDATCTKLNTGDKYNYILDDSDNRHDLWGLGNTIYSLGNQKDPDKWFDIVINIQSSRLTLSSISYIEINPRTDMDGWGDKTQWTSSIDGYVDAQNGPWNRSKYFYIDEIIINDDPNPRTSVIPGRWTGTANTDWNDGKNWSNYVPPFYTTDVIIPAGLSNYPVLNNSTPYPLNGETTYNDCNTILLAPGAKLANQHLLTVQAGNGATVNYSLPKGRWNMIATPVAAKVQKFYFDHSPETWLQRFGTNQWNYILDLNHNLEIGDGFALYVDGNETETQDFSVSGNFATTATVEKSSLTSYQEDGHYFALVGNPYLTSIDFSKLSGASSYLIYTGSAYAGYNVEVGTYGVEPNVPDAIINEFIAPLQSFIIESTSDITEFEIPATAQATDATSVLRSSENATDKLSIIAATPTTSVKTVIAQRESGESSHKLFDDISAIPDVYTLSGNEHFGVQLIQTGNQIIPIGLRTSYTGNISFIFTGMDSYNANITFKDMVAGVAQDITGLDTYTYEFDYTPASDNEENRFFVQLAPKTITGISNLTTDRIIGHRYYNLQGVEIAKPQTGIYLEKAIYQSGAISVSKIIRK